MDTFASRSARTRWRRFVEQLNTLALSVLLGLIVWLIAINQENPIVQSTYPERLPITVRGLDESLMSLQDLSRETVQVVVQAPRSSWENLEPNDFSAYIDLSDMGPGVHDVGIQVDSFDPRVRIVDIQRPELRVQLDEVRTKAVPVRVDILDSAAFGYDWQTPLVEPMTVTIQGPSTQVLQVTAAHAEISLGSAKSQVERNQAVVLQNTQGQLVPRVTANPPVVHVVVPVEQWPGRKEVAVRVNLEGQPAAGYRLSSVRVNPSTVVLLGSAEVLAQVPGFVETDPISLNGATGEIQRRVQVRLPTGVTVLEGPAVDVTASITPIEGGTTVRQRPIIQGLSPGLTATVALDTVDVILSGPLPFLEALGPDDVFVILDLNGLLPGNHIVTPRVVVPTGIRAEGVIPETVEVVIAAPATPGPGLEPGVPLTPTATITNGVPITIPSDVIATPERGPTPVSPLRTPTAAPQPTPTAIRSP